jgi:hypothetical protein
MTSDLRNNIRYSLGEYRGPILTISNKNLKIVVNHILTNDFCQKMMLQEASLDSCEAYLSVCESNDTFPRAPFTVWAGVNISLAVQYVFLCTEKWHCLTLLSSP